MAYAPTSEESQFRLRQLIAETRERGDECLAVLLAGVSLYITAGRETDLLGVMRDQLRDLWEAVGETPTTEELEKLYRVSSPPEKPNS